MSGLLENHRLELFFGILVLFFSFVGVLGYINPDLIINAYFLIVFFLGIMLGSILIQMSLAPHFSRKGAFAPKKAVRRRR